MGKGFIDLHTHTIASDGSMTPSELVRHAVEHELSAVAITDHDTMDGVEKAMEEGKKLGIEVIAGVEISVDFSEWFLKMRSEAKGEKKLSNSKILIPEMHILGYFFNKDYESILMTLKELRNRRRSRNAKTAKALKDLGYNISIEEVNDAARGGNAGRSHFARLMVQKSYVKSVNEAFNKYLSSGKPAYFKKEKLSPEEGIAEIIKAGGIAALAHPKYLYLNDTEMDTVISWLANAGLGGVEALYSENTKKETALLKRLAKKHNLAVTGGSDFHGYFKEGIEIGVGRGSLRVPYRVLAELRGD